MNVPLADDVQESVETPDPVTLVRLSVQLRPVDGDTIPVRLTTLVKPLTAVTVIAELAVPPTLIAADVGLALIVKS